MPHISRFKLKDSDRSGFKHYELELVKDGPFKVYGEEYDTPPPSKKPLGGEGDVSAGETRTNSNFADINLDTQTPTEVTNPTFFITAAGGITPAPQHPFMLVSGSNSNISISANPQIVAGKEGNFLTLVGVGSTITIANGNGIALMGSGSYAMGSGDTINLWYTTAGNVWWETSRTKGGGF